MGVYVDAFDLDHTLISGNASFSFGKYLFRKKVLGALTFFSLILFYLRFRFFRMPVQDLHHKSFKLLLQGRLSHQVCGMVESFLDEYLDRMIYQPALDRLRLAQSRDHVTAIYSSSPDFLVAPIAKRLGVRHWQGTKYSINSQGCFESIEQVLDGPDKATLLSALVQNLGVGLDATTVYSDSSMDLPFLRAGGRAIAVNPDKRLLAASIQEGWEVI